MAKFSVGEIVAHIGEHDGICTGWKTGERAEILKIGPFPVGSRVDDEGCAAEKGDYLIKSLDSGDKCMADEYELRKLPGGDAEDPGLTRLKKLLLQDTPKVFQPVKA